MYYLLYNSLSGSASKSLNKINKYIKKRKIESKLLSILDDNIVSDVLMSAKQEDKIVILGGDGTLNHFVQNELIKNTKASILLYKAGSGNDFAREHKGRLIDITVELKNTPYFILNEKRINFLNGVGMGIDACVCKEVNAHSDGSYFKTALRVFKSFKPFTVKMTIDGKVHELNNVFFFVCMNGKNIGGGMKVAPHAKRNDGILDIYVIMGKSYKEIVPVFPLIYLGLHTIFKKHVKYFKGTNIEIQSSVALPIQTDGEVIENVSEFSVHDNTNKNE